MKAEEWKPIGPCVVVKVDKEDEISKGGIILTSSAVDFNKRTATIGTLISVGGQAFKNDYDAKFWEADMKKGTRIVFQKDGHYELRFKDGDYRLMNDTSVLMRKTK